MELLHKTVEPGTGFQPVPDSTVFGTLCPSQDETKSGGGSGGSSGGDGSGGISKTAEADCNCGRHGHRLIYLGGAVLCGDQHKQRTAIYWQFFGICATDRIIDRNCDVLPIDLLLS